MERKEEKKKEPCSVSLVGPGRSYVQPVVHLKGFASGLDFRDKGPAHACATFLADCFPEKKGTLVWDGDLLKKDSFTMLIPMVHKLCPGVDLVAFREAGRCEGFRASWGAFKVPVGLRPVELGQKAAGKFVELGRAAILETNARTVVSFGGGQTSCEEFRLYGRGKAWHLFPVQRMNKFQNKMEETPLLKIRSIVRHSLSLEATVREPPQKRPRARQGGGRPSDSPDFVKLSPGDRVGKYTVCAKIGHGTFGHVYSIRGGGRGEMYAGKVMEASGSYIQYDSSAEREAKVLDGLKEHPNALDIEEWFTLENNPAFYCLVLEYMGPSAFDLIQANGGNGVEISVIQSVCRQMFSLLDFLEDNGFTHTDIKHKNICFVHQPFWKIENFNHFPSQAQRLGRKKPVFYHPTDTTIKLIDYGNATHTSQPHPFPIHTKQFRAPEIIFRDGTWGPPSDVWTLGVTLAYLYTGRLLTNSHNPGEIVGMCERLTGKKVPRELLRRGKMRKMKPRGQDLGTRWNGKSKKIKNTKPLTHWIQGNCESHGLFLQVVLGMLEFDPKDRWSAKQCLGHEFCRISIAREIVIGKNVAKGQLGRPKGQSGGPVILRCPSHTKV